MRFEGRDLRPYSEAVSPSELRDGAIYFLVDFLDNDMQVPILEPVVFIGRDLNLGDVGQLYFQDALSYREGERFGTHGDGNPEPTFIQTAETRMRPVFQYEDALEVLMRCSLRRREGSAG